MAAEMEKYTEATELPILVEFCYLSRVNKTQIWELAGLSEELSDSIRRLLAKKETELERGVHAKRLNPTMAVFSLKQMGWRDSHDEIKAPPSKKLVIEIAPGN